MTLRNSKRARGHSSSVGSRSVTYAHSVCTSARASPVTTVAAYQPLPDGLRGLVTGSLDYPAPRGPFRLPLGTLVRWLALALGVQTRPAQAPAVVPAVTTGSLARDGRRFSDCVVSGFADNPVSRDRS